MVKHQLLVIFPLRPKAMSQLSEHYILHRYDLADDKIAFLKEYGERCEAVVTNGHQTLNREQLAYLPNLKIVCCSSAGYEYIDTEALKQRGIALTHSSAALADDVADMAVLLSLSAVRDLVRAHDYVASGAWGEQGMYPLMHTMKGKRVGLVGMGTIGQAIATRLLAMKADISYIARSKKALPYNYFSDLNCLASWADMLVVIVPGGEETRGLINRKILTSLGAKGLLVNVARGTVVYEPDLIDCLVDGSLGGAALDVYWDEPTPNKELVSLPNVTLYPHHASGTVETRDAMAQTVVDSLADFFADKTLAYQVLL
ncbi:MAG: 2-hydroxyacid dehydrogenase [Pontibacterium sp.]